MKLDQETLHKKFDYDPYTGLFYNKIDAKGKNKGKKAGSIRKDDYIQIKIKGKHYLAHRLVWLYVYGYWPENQIDHINRIPIDNRLINLREVKQSCNTINSKDRSDNSTGIRGVSHRKRSNKYLAYINIKGKRHYSIELDDFDEVVCWRLAFEQCLEFDKFDRESSAYLYVKKLFN